MVTLRFKLSTSTVSIMTHLTTQPLSPQLLAEVWHKVPTAHRATPCHQNKPKPTLDQPQPQQPLPRRFNHSHHHYHHHHHHHHHHCHRHHHHNDRQGDDEGKGGNEGNGYEGEGEGDGNNGDGEGEGDGNNEDGKYECECEGDGDNGNNEEGNGQQQMRYAPPACFFFCILIPTRTRSPLPNHKPLCRSSTKTELAGLGFGLFPFVSLLPYLLLLSTNVSFTKFPSSM
jgi:hypothetical protein